MLQVDSLCAVWISHKHADHMLGLPGILQARSAGSPPLLVSVAPTCLTLWPPCDSDVISEVQNPFYITTPYHDLGFPWVSEAMVGINGLQ